MPGPCTVRPRNILHFLFYIQKQERPSHTLIFLFLFKNLSMQNLNLCKTHRFTELLVIRSPMPIYIRKKNVEKVIFFFFFVFRFSNKQIQKNRETKIYFHFPFFVLLAKIYQKTKNKNLLLFSVFCFIQKIPKKRKTKIDFRFSFYLQSKQILVCHFR